MESVKVFGLVDITVLAAGSLFLGEVHEPIKSTKNPNGLLLMGIPFSKRPTALRFDYKVRIADAPQRIRATGFSRTGKVAGKDHAAVVCLLQKRWEDAEGNVYAKRVGTFAIQYSQSTDWHNAATYNILYGDITHNPAYRAEWMKLNAYEYNTVNSHGKSVRIQEVGWAAPDETPTHLVLQFASSHGGAYIGRELPVGGQREAGLLSLSPARHFRDELFLLHRHYCHVLLFAIDQQQVGVQALAGDAHASATLDAPQALQRNDTRTGEASVTHDEPSVARQGVRGVDDALHDDYEQDQSDGGTDAHVVPERETGACGKQHQEEVHREVDAGVKYLVHGGNGWFRTRKLQNSEEKQEAQHRVNVLFCSFAPNKCNKLP